jgi:hypothetical protein
VRLAERISNKCNPPKPERESKRKKQKKELNEDFVDITQGNAFFFLGGRTSAKKKAPAKAAKSKNSVEAGAFVGLEPVPEPRPPAAKPAKKPPKKRAAKFPVEDVPPSKQLKFKLPTRPVSISELTPEMGLQSMPGSAYDLTDQVWRDSSSPFYLFQEPILRLLNLQLQRQRCSRLERFSKQTKIFFSARCL